MSEYVIAVGVCHHALACISFGLITYIFYENDYIPSCDGLHTRLRLDLLAIFCYTVTRGESMKKLILILLSVCIMVSFSGCVSDWLYELPNDYAISNNAYVTVDFVKITSKQSGSRLDEFLGFYSCSLNTVIESYINEFCYNEQYVAVKQFDPEKLDFENFELNDFSDPLYYLVDTVSTNIYGPYKSQEEFDFACKELNVVGLGEWISTRSNPNKKQRKSNLLDRFHF